MRGHGASLGLSLDLTLKRYGGRGLDPLVSAFKAESGATDVSGLNDLIAYVRGQGLINNFVIYPMKSAQNAGSGATVYSLGGLTTNDITLVNSPAWSSTDIDLEGATTYATFTIPNFQDATEGVMFTRFKPRIASAADSMIQNRWNWGDATLNRYLGTSNSTNSLSGETFTTQQQNALTARTGSSTFSWSAGEDFTEVAQFGSFGSTAGIWKNKSAITMNLSSGSQNFWPAATGYTNDNQIAISSTIATSPSGQTTGKWIAQALLIGVTPTTAQRETITDLINAL